MQWNFRLLWRDLINIFKCNKAIKHIINFLTYPCTIIPRINYVYPIDINRLNETGEYVLVRRSEKTSDEIFNKLGILRDDILLDNSIPGMSMNLLGAHFKEKYIKFVPKPPASDYWNTTNNVKLRTYLDKIDVLGTCCPIFFLVKDLQNLQFPYTRPSDKDSKKLLAALNIQPAQDGLFHIVAKTEIRHKPSNLNYWHVEFTIIESDNKNAKPIKDVGSKWRKMLVHSIQHVISNAAKKERPLVPVIGKEHYLKSVS